MRDRVLWVPAIDGRFSVKSALKVIRNPNPMVPWYGTVWFKGNVPGWAFIEWLGCWGRLATKDRLQEWGMHVDAMCLV